MNAKKFAAKKSSSRVKKMADGGMGSAPSWAASAPTAGSGMGGMGGGSASPAGGGLGGTGGNINSMASAIKGMGGGSASPAGGGLGGTGGNINSMASAIKGMGDSGGYGGGPASFTQQSMQSPMSTMQSPMGMAGGMNRMRGMGPMAAGMGNIPGGGGLRGMAKGGFVENSKMTKKVAGYFSKIGNKSLAAHENREAAGIEKDTPAIAKREMKALKGAPAGMKSYEKKEHAAMGMNCGGKVMKYAKGGGIESKGKTQGKFIKMASGGSVSARADGVAIRGKTKCKIC